MATYKEEAVEAALVEMGYPPGRFAEDGIVKRSIRRNIDAAEPFIRGAARKKERTAVVGQIVDAWAEGEELCPPLAETIAAIRKEIEDRLLSDEAVKAVADLLAKESGWEGGSDEFEAWKHNDPDDLPSFLDDARQLLRAALASQEVER